MATKKDLGLEGLRGMAALSVVIGHFAFIFFPYLAAGFYPMPGAVPIYDFERWIVYPPFSLLFCANAAVNVFFVMSGYVLAASFLAKDDFSILESGASKRYIRLVLPSLASVMLAYFLWKTGAIITQESLAIGVAGWVPTWYVGPFGFFSSIKAGLIDAPLFSITALNPPLWTIQVELIGSIFLYSMIGLFWKRPILLIAWSCFLADVLAMGTPNTLLYLSFVAGAAINPARNWLKSHEIFSITLVVLGLVGVSFASYQPLFAPIQAIPLPTLSPTGPDLDSNHQIFWNTIGAVLLVAGTVGSSWFNWALSCRFLVFLGKISFSIYLVHVPILVSVGLFTSKCFQGAGYSYGSSAFIAFGAFIVVTLILSLLFEKYVDEPSTRLANYVANKNWFWAKKPELGNFPVPIAPLVRSEVLRSDVNGIVPKDATLAATEQETPTPTKLVEVLEKHHQEVEQLRTRLEQATSRAHDLELKLVRTEAKLEVATLPKST